MFSTIKIFLLIFAFFYKNAFCGELSFATEGLFCQVGVICYTILILIYFTAHKITIVPYNKIFNSVKIT